MAAIFNLQDNDVEYMYCLIAFLDSENGLGVCIGEIIVYQLLTTIWLLQWFNGGRFEFCMMMMSNKCIVCILWYQKHMAAILNFAW